MGVGVQCVRVRGCYGGLHVNVQGARECGRHCPCFPEASCVVRHRVLYTSRCLKQSCRRVMAQDDGARWRQASHPAQHARS